MSALLSTIPLAAQSMQTGTLAPDVEQNSAAISVYAAGSLRESMGALVEAFLVERHGGRHAETSKPSEFKFLFGPSGRLRERIAAGDSVDVFASASPTHTDRLLKEGKLRSSNVFASNSMCVIARPGVKISTETVIDSLLSSDLILGVSTPGADPAGDYTWEMFKKIDAERPGAFSALERKAKKLVGAEINQTDTVSPYAKLLTEKQADLFVTYCTNAASAKKINGDISMAKVPASIDVSSAYAIGLSTTATDSAREFVRYVLSQRAQKVMAQFGFSPPSAKCDGLAPPLSEAYAAWTGPALPVKASGGAKDEPNAPDIRLGQRLQLSLRPQESLAFGRAARTKVAGLYGGALSFVPKATGRIEVFVDRRAWVDVVRIKDQTATPPIRSDRWLGCAGVGKNMSFDVVAGERYELRLSGMDAAEATALVFSLPTITQKAATTK